MAKINLDISIKMPNGQEMLTSLEDKTPITLAAVMMDALLTPMAGDTETPNLPYRLYALAKKVGAGGEVELDAGDIVVIEKRVERRHPPWIVGVCWDALEQRDGPPQELPALESEARGPRR